MHIWRIFRPSKDSAGLEHGLRTPDNQHWYDLSVDAQSGAALQSYDWTDHASYNVFALPTESPNDGARTIVTDAQDRRPRLSAGMTPNGVAGAEFTDTRGNNVSAQKTSITTTPAGSAPMAGRA